MIPIRNIYYMLAYVFKATDNPRFRKLETEEFDDIEDLCAALMELGLSDLVKRGISRSYIPRQEETACPRGKFEIAETIRRGFLMRKQVVCLFDEFSVDSPLNRIVKTCALLLLGADIKPEKKSAIRKLLRYFSDVQTLDLCSVDWNMNYHRYNRHYRLLMSVCYLTANRLLPTKNEGGTRLMDVAGDRGDGNLYEKFVYEYFRKEFPQISVRAAYIPWAVGEADTSSLPRLETDITMEYGGKILIIDTKYYGEITKSRYDGKLKLQSDHVRQIYAYVKNKAAAMPANPENVAGLLLYAETDKKLPDLSYPVHGNDIYARCLDLNQPFPGIRARLDGIVRSYFGV